MADQPVELVAHDPAWMAAFAAERSDVEAALAPWLAGPVEHIGSTAVPGCRPNRSWTCSPRCTGWPTPRPRCRCWRSGAGCSGRRTRTATTGCGSCGPIRSRARTTCTSWSGGPQARALLAFRDALRADPRVRAEYAALKVELATRHRTDRNAYTDAKAPFVRRVLAAAGVHQPERPPLSG